MLKKIEESKKIGNYEKDNGFKQSFILAIDEDVSDLKDLDVDERDNYLNIELGNQEYMVFASYSGAEYYTKQMLQDQIDGGELYLWNEDFVSHYIYISDTDRRIIANEESYYRVEDMSDDEILEYRGLDDEYNALIESGENGKALDLIENAREEIIEEVYEEWYKGLEDPIDFLVEEMGIYSKEDLLKQPFIQIDEKKLIQDSIDTGGVGHYLAGYDNDELVFEYDKNDFYVYRTN